MTILLTVAAYFAALMLFSRLTARRGDNNETFFRANRRSPWYMVAFGMVGASISGITFVSVPGMVMRTDMTYVQTCIGFILGYFAIAFLLLPVYYRLNLTTIYSYLKERLGKRSYKTGAWFFLTSKMTGAAVRFYVVCIILQRFVFDAVGVPFPITVVGMTLLIWLYTRRGGIKTLVWTDTFQTTCMFAALLLIIYNVTQQLGMSVGEAVRAVAADGHSRMFVWDDWVSTQNFWKQLLSGAFIAIVMTGLDQDMMQKNLTCKSLREAQKDVCTYGFAFVPANLLFMALGVLLMMLAQKEGTPLPTAGDVRCDRRIGHRRHGVLHHRHRGGVVLQCRLGAHGAHHELLRRHLRASRGRASASPCACGHRRGVRGVHSAVPYAQLYERHRCHLRALLLHLRSAVRFVRLRTAHAPRRQRPPRALCMPRLPPTLLRSRHHRAASLGLPLRLRAAHDQRGVHLRRAVGYEQRKEI